MKFIDIFNHIFMISNVLGSIVYLSLPPIIIDDKFENFDINKQNHIQNEISDETVNSFLDILQKLIIFSNYSQQDFREDMFPYKYNDEIYNNFEEFNNNFLFLGFNILSSFHLFWCLSSNHKLVSLLKIFFNSNSYPQYSNNIFNLDKNYYHFINLMICWEFYHFFSKLKYFKFGGDLILVFYSLEIIEYDLLLRSYDIFFGNGGLNVKQDQILPVIKQQVNEFINKYKDYPIVKNDTRLKELLDK